MIQSKDQLQLLLHQHAEKAARQDRPVPGRFLTGAELNTARSEAKRSGVQVSFYGGWTDAERVQCCFFPFGLQPEYNGQWVEISWNAKFSVCDHRALLGSLMALGIDRSYFGDLMLQNDRAYLYCLPQVAVRLPMEWTEAGHTPLKVKLPDESPVIAPPSGRIITDTVASLRLDSILECGMQSSRSKAAEIIKRGNVMVDHLPQERTDKNLSEGSLLSVHGFGRIRLKKVGSPTKKGRLPVTLQVFCSK